MAKSISLKFSYQKVMRDAVISLYRSISTIPTTLPSARALRHISVSLNRACSALCPSLIHFHLPNVITRSHCSLLNHISSFARFILISMLIWVITSLSFIFHLLLGLDYILTNVFLYIFSHTPFLFFLFLID